MNNVRYHKCAHNGLLYSCICKHMHAHKHTFSHMHNSTRGHLWTQHIPIHTYICMHIMSYVLTMIHAHQDAHALSFLCTCTQIHLLSYRPTHTSMLTPICGLTHPHAPKLTHMHTHTEWHDFAANICHDIKSRMAWLCFKNMPWHKVLCDF